jgi:hypothetical protein
MKTKPIPETVKIEVNIKTGPVPPASRQAWKCFWRKGISECQRELQAESEAKK